MAQKGDYSHHHSRRISNSRRWIHLCSWSWQFDTRVLQKSCRKERRNFYFFLDNVYINRQFGSKSSTRTATSSDDIEQDSGNGWNYGPNIYRIRDATTQSSTVCRTLQQNSGISQSMQAFFANEAPKNAFPWVFSPRLLQSPQLGTLKPKSMGMRCPPLLSSPFWLT